MGMSYSLALNQKVNFYVSVAFIGVFGFIMTSAVVSAINRNINDLQYLSVSSELSQLHE